MTFTKLGKKMTTTKLGKNLYGAVAFHPEYGNMVSYATTKRAVKKLAAYDLTL